jgi:hypothetical protein
MDIQTFSLYLPIFVAVCLALFILARYLSHSEPDNAVEAKLNDAERLNKESGIEAYRIRETVADSKTAVDRIRERESEARESVELAESAVREAHQDNRRAEEIIDDCIAIIETAEKKG